MYCPGMSQIDMFAVLAIPMRHKIFVQLRHGPPTVNDWASNFEVGCPPISDTHVQMRLPARAGPGRSVVHGLPPAWCRRNLVFRAHLPGCGSTSSVSLSHGTGILGRSLAFVKKAERAQ